MNYFCCWIVLLISILLGTLPFLLEPDDARFTTTGRDLADLDSRFVAVNGIELHYKDVGDRDAETVFILLHGFSTNIVTWRHVLQPLSKLGRVVAFDRIGHGLSARPINGAWQRNDAWRSSGSPYAPSAQPAFVVGLMNALGIQRAILVGNSAGGSVALRTALRFPERVRALVVADADWISSGMMPSASLSWLWSSAPVRRLGVYAMFRLLGANNIDTLLKLSWHDVRRISRQEIADAVRVFTIGNYSAALWEFACSNEPNALPEQASSIGVPTLVLHGDDDQIVSVVDSRELTKRIANSRLVVVPDCGHMPQEEQPAVFMREVQQLVLELKNR